VSDDALRAADRIVDTLADLGTTDLFTLCGNHVLPIQEAMRSRDLRPIAMRSEAATVMAADAYGRIARRVGVAVVTGGPGMSNTVTALLTAQGNRSPLVVISGEPEQVNDGRGGQQETDHLGLSAPVVKWHQTVRRADHVEEVLVEAFRVAQTGRTGPVHVSIPLDVQRKVVRKAESFVDGASVVMGGPPPQFVHDAARLVREAARPVVVAGASLWQSGGENAAARLAETAGLPFFTLDSARGIIPDSSPYAFGYADRSLNKAAEALVEADVVLVVGRAIDFRLGLGASFSESAQIIHVDTDLGALGRNARRVRSSFADPAVFLGDLADALGDHRVDGGWLARLESARTGQERELDQAVAGAGEPSHPAEVARTIARVGNSHQAIYALDCGEFVQWCRQVIPSEAPGRWLRLGPQSTCGAGLPFGIGAKVAAPGSPVVVIAGDGGIGYHISELEAAVRHEIPLVVVVGEDQGWGIERNLQNGIYGQGAEYTTKLNSVRLPQIAEGFGARGIQVDDAHALGDVLDEALAQRMPTLIQVPVQTVPSALTLGMIRREREALSREVERGLQTQ
jgi:acetolactate synthase-1/2/3 large subunit